MKKLCQNCQNCQHWTRGDKTVVEFHGNHMGHCNCQKFVYSGEGEIKPEPDGFEYWDYESYAANFMTGEDFGCVHWIRKEL